MAKDNVIGISFDAMNDVKRKIRAALAAAEAEKDYMTKAINSLSYTDDGRLKQKSEELRSIRSKVEKRISELQRLDRHIDYAVKRFKEVDSECAKRISSRSHDYNKTLGLPDTNVLDGIFDALAAGAKVWWEANTAPYKLIGDWIVDHEQEIITGAVIFGIAAASIALGIITCGASVPAEMALLSTMAGSAMIGGGIAIGFKGISDVAGDGKFNNSAREYVGAYTGGAITGALAPLGGELLPAANAVWNGTCAMAGNVVDQTIGKGTVNYSEALTAAVTAGVFTYGLNKIMSSMYGTNLAKEVVTPNKALETASKSKTFCENDLVDGYLGDLMSPEEAARYSEHWRELGIGSDKTWKAFAEANPGKTIDDYYELVNGMSPWPIGQSGTPNILKAGDRFYMAVENNAPENMIGGFGVKEKIPSTQFIRENLAVKSDWKKTCNVIREFEVKDGVSLNVLEGPVGPQIDLRIDTYLPGDMTITQYDLFSPLGWGINRGDYVHIVDEYWVD